MLDANADAPRLYWRGKKREPAQIARCLQLTNVAVLQLSVKTVVMVYSITSFMVVLFGGNQKLGAYDDVLVVVPVSLWTDA